MLLSWLTLALAATTAEPVIPIEGSAWRMSEPTRPESGGMSLRLFTDRNDCAGLLDLSEASKGEDPAQTVGRCLPWVDAARGEIVVAFEIHDNGRPIPVALEPEMVTVELGAERGHTTLDPSALTLEPMRSMGFGQLWVLLIDRSSSMYAAGEAPDGTRQRPVMENLVGSLKHPRVVEAFFPSGNAHQTAVMLLTFDRSVKDAWEQPWQDATIFAEREEYLEAVDWLLYRPLEPGYTHLYDSVGEVAEELLTRPEIATAAGISQADPALVVLTDGFNNESASDLCRTNAERLNPLIWRLEKARADAERWKLAIHTVGLGRPMLPSFEVPSVVSRLSGRQLCGSGLMDQRIDGVLDTQFIDNVSLSYISAVSGGTTYVGEDPSGLVSFLESTGVTLYRWYMLRIRLDESHLPRLRRPLPMRLRVLRPVETEATFTLFPHPWFDAPPGRVLPGESWSERQSVWAATGTMLKGVGGTLGFIWLVMAIHHAWRTIRRRAGVRRAR
jgi:hypothetical protein